MKPLFIIFSGLIFTSFVTITTPDETNPFFAFCKTTLNNFNEARRLLASGDFRKLFKIIEDFVPKSLFNGDILGPASNMYKLKWSRELEQIGFEYMTDKKVKRSEKMLASIEYKDYIGFYWMGNVLGILEAAVPAIKANEVKPLLKKFLDVLEALIIFIWMAVAAPKTLPLVEGKLYGPAEAFFGERYEIGCFTELFYSVCFMKRLPYSENMFKVGVPCTTCPTHCEFSELIDGTYDEGELCVAPVENQVNFVSQNMTLTDGSSSGISFVVLIAQLAYAILMTL
ncbi:hypothetical protein B9Z55_012017 [Caenorhabditis nigoni]|uniref:NR LBD domain-containing protein n=1 Tax=Caenorhabditis nigoni TaxID=1611254 RepID=A0A2G5TVG3_9PELO|nr:hypothetical protein B9Z55_012017 [Caenorhabditis nigoni]